MSQEATYLELIRPNDGVTLGLDIAERLGWFVVGADGLDILEGGELTFTGDSYTEQKYKLKSWLEGVVDAYSVTRIAVEGVFEGPSFATTSRLLVIGTAASDVAYERGIPYVAYVNSEWKATLRSLTTQYEIGLNDKDTVQNILAVFGFVHSSEHVNDAVGVLVHDKFVLQQQGKSVRGNTSRRKKIDCLVFAIVEGDNLGGKLPSPYLRLEYRKNVVLKKQLAMLEDLTTPVFFEVKDNMYLGVDALLYSLPLDTQGILVVPKVLARKYLKDYIERGKLLRA